MGCSVLLEVALATKVNSQRMMRDDYTSVPITIMGFFRLLFWLIFSKDGAGFGPEN